MKQAMAARDGQDAVGWREITYAGPGLLVGSRLLSRLGLLSSSAFLQGLLSFTLICLECKFQGFPLARGPSLQPCTQGS